jgi:hypothetical protein
VKRSSLSIVFLALATGCSGAGLQEDFALAGDTAPEDFPEGTLRLDVYPPAGVTEPELLPQSHILPPGAYESASVDLYRTLSLSGTVTGEVARGWSLGAPTSTEPLVATLTATVAGSLLGGSARSDETGAFTLSFPNYPNPALVAIVPEDGALAPVRVIEGAELDSDRARWDQALPTGIPVYGRIQGTVDGVAEGLSGVQLRLVRMVGTTAIASSVFTTDRTGWYLGRVEETGDYVLEVVGGATSAVGRVAPDVLTDVLVEGEDGVEVSLDLGEVQHAAAIGTVLDAEGNRIADAHLRFTATSLDAGVGTLDVETETSVNGDFVAFLLPGTYDIDVIAPYDDAAPLTPVHYDGIRVSADADLGAVRLASAGHLSGTVFDARGNPASNVLVTATEQGFDGYVFYGHTDDDGAFTLPVSDVPLAVSLTPPAGQVPGAVTFLDVNSPGNLKDLDLDPGVQVTGSVSFEDAAVGYAAVEVRDATSGVLLGLTTTDEAGTFALQVSVPTDADTGDAADTGSDTGADTAAR